MASLAKYLTNYQSDKKTVAKGLRQKRIQPFLQMIETVYDRKGSVSILDIGGTVQYWKIVDDEVLRNFNVEITALNLPGAKVMGDTDIVKHANGDATADIWDDYDMSSFDLIHSNSVLEHVGDWQKMKMFANNIKAFSGGYFVQTPNFWFPIEPHCMTPFFHWLPKPVRVALVKRMSLGHWPKAGSVSEAVEMVESARLVNRSMLAALFDDAEVISEKVLLLSKSFVAIKQP